jgi:DNA-binding IclR family transcriptional regulator
VLRGRAGGGARRPPPGPDDPDAARLLEELRGRARAGTDELAAALGWRTSRTAVALMRLQLEGFVELLPGGRFAALGEV